jgi:hypothetical protein
MDVFANSLNTYMVTLFSAQMGAASAYTTLKAQTINTRIFANQLEWPYWTLPAISVACHRVDYGNDGHDGGARRRYSRAYQCMAVGLIAGSVGEINTLVWEFYERIERVLSEQKILVSVEGITSRGLARIVGGNIDEQMYATDDTSSTRRIGVADIRFTIEAKG